MDSLMHAMYIIAVIAVATGIIDLFTSTEKLSKYTKYATSLVIISALLSPLGNLISELPENVSELDLTSQDTPSNSVDQLKRSLNSAITYSIEVYFSIPQNTIETTVDIHTKDSEILIDSITVLIKNIDYNRYYERIDYYLKSNYGCEVIVVQSFKE